MIYYTNELITNEHLILNPNTVFLIGGPLINELYIKDNGYKTKNTIHQNLISLSMDKNYYFRPELHLHQYKNKLNEIVQNLFKLNYNYNIVICRNSNYKEENNMYEEIKNKIIDDFVAEYPPINNFIFNNEYKILDIPTKINKTQNNCLLSLMNYFCSNEKLMNFTPISVMYELEQLKERADIIQQHAFNFEKYMYMSCSIISFNSNLNIYHYKVNGLVYKFDNKTEESIFLLKHL